MEKRGRLEETTHEKAECQIQGWRPSLPHLVRVNEAAQKARQLRFTNLLHHVNVAALERAFRRQRRSASPGVDRMTVKEYEQDLESNLRRLHERIHGGRYWPKPVRRTYIPKADGGKRPLGIPVLEDKIVQGAVAEVLSAIYEVDFVDFSYGFRPKRSPHLALRALNRNIKVGKVSWVLDVDIRSFFDTVDHGWLLRMVAHRIADRRILRLIERWLKAGVLESGSWRAVETGTPQGSGISPLLANVFLHYIFDLWFEQWCRRHARGEMVATRYADDLVLGFQYEDEAREMLVNLKERLAKFGLALNETKTRLIQFGRFAAQNREERGQRRPETFDFLGLTHYCGKLRSGKFTVKRKTQRKRMTAKLKAMRVEMKRRMHSPMQAQHQWLSQVLRGHYGYYGVISNLPAISAFYREVRAFWYTALCRRRQRSGMTWARFERLLTIFPLPTPVIHERSERLVA